MQSVSEVCGSLYLVFCILYLLPFILSPRAAMFLLVQNCRLFFYANMSNTTADGVINLLNYYEICRGKSKDKKYYFQVVPTSKDLKIVNFYVEFSAERER